jgi:hypothetical protein
VSRRERVLSTNYSHVGKTVDTPLLTFLRRELAMKSGFVEEGERQSKHYIVQKLIMALIRNVTANILSTRYYRI